MADISKITLPSGNTYDIKDATARQMISGGVSFIIAWDGTSTPTVANIPAGVVVSYNGTSYTGALAASDATAGAFYLVKSSTTPSGDVLDIYDEYVPVGSGTNKTWEKIGDTTLNLTDVVTDVTLNKTTDTVIGTGATFTVTNPTIANTLYDSTATGRVGVITAISPTTTNIKATASGTAVSASGDNVTAVTGYSNPTTQSVATSVTPTTRKLATTTVTGVSGSTTASKATAATSQTTATGAGTASTTNTDWLKGVSVSNETLVLGAATLNTQTTTQFTFSNVTVPQAASATTVATGSTTTSGSGADVVTNVAVGDTVDAITALGTPSTDTVLGTASTFNVTQPTVALATGASAGTGVISVATGASGTIKYLGSAASGGAVSVSGDEVTAVTTATLNVTRGNA